MLFYMIVADAGKIERHSSRAGTERRRCYLTRGQLLVLGGYASAVDSQVACLVFVVGVTISMLFVIY
jgi:hypothetical protein